MSPQAERFLTDFGRVGFVIIGLYVYFTVVEYLFELLFHPSIPTAGRWPVHEVTAAYISIVIPIFLVAVFTLLLHFVWKYYSSPGIFWIERECFFIGYIVYFSYHLFLAIVYGSTLTFPLTFTVLLVLGIVAKIYLEPKLFDSYSSIHSSSSDRVYRLGRKIDDD